VTEPPVPEFPQEFLLKIIGQDTPAFHAAVAAILAEHVAPLERLNISRQPSREGRFVSLSVGFTAGSREQLDALYRALSGSEHVFMAL
jgi:putative lipoic acid-binding regulatory protein